MRWATARGRPTRSTSTSPFILPVGRPEAGLAFGLFYDTLSDCVFDFGKEVDNYQGPYRSFTADHGDLDYYFIAGPRVDQVVPRFTWLAGRPAFMPKWGLGYSGSSMAYTDAPDAQARMSKFLERCAEQDILCDSFHLSSGYTSIGDRRHVFNCNRSKFPDPAALAQAISQRACGCAPMSNRVFCVTTHFSPRPLLWAF